MSDRMRRYRVLAILCGIVAATLVWLLLWSLYASRDMYRQFKRPERGWRGRVHRPDPELGFSPIPNSTGFHTFPIGPDLAMRYDQDGFRVPVSQDDRQPRTRPFILALGCSFTYGDGCKAEETFVYRLGKSLGGTSLNAGVCSYGLAQLLLQARKLIPQYRPDFVLVQYSPWLNKRAMSELASTYYGLVAAPYFSDGSGGEIRLNAPPFRTIIFDLPFDRYRDTPAGALDWLSFCARCWIPLQVHDRFQEASLRYRQAHQHIPTPTRNGQKIRDLVYREIADICRRYGARMVVVSIGRPLERSERQWLRGLPRAIVVDAQSGLDRFSRQRHVSSDRLYGLWRGSPPVMVDGHPNALAHRIIAQEITAALSAELPMGATLR